jgi:hypothetical protein
MSSNSFPEKIDELTYSTVLSLYTMVVLSAHIHFIYVKQQL